MWHKLPSPKSNIFIWSDTENKHHRSLGFYDALVTQKRFLKIGYFIA